VSEGTTRGTFPQPTALFSDCVTCSPPKSGLRFYILERRRFFTTLQCFPLCFDALRPKVSMKSVEKECFLFQTLSEMPGLW